MPGVNGHAVNIFKNVSQHLSLTGIITCQNRTVRAAVKTACCLSQSHETLCYPFARSLRPFTTTYLELPRKIINICVVRTIELTKQVSCFLLTIFDKRQENVAQTCEPTGKRQREIRAIHQMSESYDRRGVEMEWIAFEDVGCIRICKCTIDCV